MFQFDCQHCGVHFERPSRVASNGKPFQFCSLSCSSQSRVKQNVYTCPECQARFTYRTKRVYCSRPCYHAAKRRKGRKTESCEQCGSRYSVSGKSRAASRKFCSKACSSRSRLTRKVEQLGGVDGIKERLVAKAREQGYWLGSSQAKAMLRVRHEFFEDVGISLEDINRSLGLKKPKSGFEEMVYAALQSAMPDATIRREVKGPKTDKGYPTRFDFMVDGKLVVEADGPQHTYEKSQWFSDEYVQRDRLKEQYCQRKGYPMIRVRHSASWTEEAIAEAVKMELSAMNHNVASNGERDGLKIIAWG